MEPEGSGAVDKVERSYVTPTVHKQDALLQLPEDSPSPIMPEWMMFMFCT